MLSLAQLGDDGEAVIPGQHHVEHDQIEVRRRIEQALERLLAGFDDLARRSPRLRG